MADSDRWSKGAVLVEAALILPLLLLLTFGIWTTARAWNVHNVLDHSAREAARYGATDPDRSAIEAVAMGTILSASIPSTSVEICSAVIDDGSVISDDGQPCMATGNGAGQDPTTDDRVQVAIRYPDYEMDFLFFSITIDMAASGVARLERGS